MAVDLRMSGWGGWLTVLLGIGLVSASQAQDAPFLTLDGPANTVVVRDFNSLANATTGFNGGPPSQATAGGVSVFTYASAVGDPKMYFTDAGGHDQRRFNWVRARFEQSTADDVFVWQRNEVGGQQTVLSGVSGGLAERTGDPSNPNPLGSGYRLDPFGSAPAGGQFTIDYLVSDRMRTIGLGEWDRAGDFNGWSPNPGAGAASVGSGLLSSTSTNGDPYLSSSTQFDADAHGLVEVRMQRSGTSNAQVFWAQNGAYTGTQRLDFTPPDAGFHTYTIDLSKTSTWTGSNMQLRLDPAMASGQTYAIDFVRARAVPVSQWDGELGGGGDGTWDGAGGNDNWRGEQDATIGGGLRTEWVNTPYDDAVFKGTAGTVTVEAGVTANDISFQTDGYRLRGATLTLDGVRPQVQVTTGTTRIDNVIAGDQGLEKTGAGTLTLNGANTFTGTTTVTGGVLQLGGAAAAQTVLNPSFEAPDVSGLSGRFLYYYGTNRPMSAGQKTDFVWVGSGDAAPGGPALFANGSAWGYQAVPDGNQGVSLQRDSGITQTINFSEPGSYSLTWDAARRSGQVNPGEVLLDGVVVADFTAQSAGWASFETALNVTTAGNHTLAFRGTVSASDLSVGIDNVAINGFGGERLQGDLVIGDRSGSDVVRLLGSERIADTSVVTINGLNLNSGKFELNGFDETVGGLQGTDTYAVVQNVENGAPLGAILSTLTVNSSADHTFAGIIRNNAGGGSQLGLTKEGTGTLTLTGALNSFSGPLLVNGGTLINNGSIPNAPLTVAPGAKVGGSGAFGAMTVTGILSPGNSVGEMFAGNTSWVDGASYLFEIDNATGVAGGPGGWDLFNLGSDTLTLSTLTANGFTIDLVTLLAGGGTNPGDMDNFVDTNNYDWEIARAGSIVGFEAGDFVIDDSGFSNAFTGTFSLNQQGSSLFISYASPVPEPGTWALLGLMLVGGLFGVRRQRGK